jgi:hypothetical protein
VILSKSILSKSRFPNFAFAGTEGSGKVVFYELEEGDICVEKEEGEKSEMSVVKAVGAGRTKSP